MANKNKSLGLVFTIIVFISLASLDNAVIGMFPTLFSSIAKDLNIHVSNLGIISAVNIFLIAFSSLFWAYFADKGGRKRLIMAGTLIWSLSVFMTSFSTTFLHLLIYQLFTGIGLGCISSIGFSVLSDSVPKKWRGTVMSIWSMSQGFGTIAGSLMASTIAPITSWRRPFLILSILGFVFIFLYLFIEEPKKGAAEPELKELFTQGFEYNYKITFKELYDLLKKRSNLLLMLTNFFMFITSGTLIWLPTLFVAKIQFQGYSQEVAVVASGYLYAISQLGGVISVYLGFWGDKLQRRHSGGRAYFTAACVFAAATLYIPMFILPMRDLAIPMNMNALDMLIALLTQIVTNPWMLAMFGLALIASATNSANNPNWLALLIDVNLPEHRATIFSIANLVTGTGRAMGNIMLGTVLGIISLHKAEPWNYIISLSIFQSFVLPAVLLYILTAKSCKKDIQDVKSILRVRSLVNQQQ